ncbi:MAG: hypothetical protein JEY94_07390 [Melioribacteraceae bacterium]|nr:hypothetical protein [Melioribacteraceae bacterium]
MKKNITHIHKEIQNLKPSARFFCACILITKHGGKLKSPVNLSKGRNPLKNKKLVDLKNTASAERIPNYQNTNQILLNVGSESNKTYHKSILSLSNG